MSEDKLIAAFEEATQLHANEAAERGLHPVHIANVLMLSAIRIAVQVGSIDDARLGLERIVKYMENELG